MRLTIYGRPGCHLCDTMKAVVHRVIADLNVPVEEIDISTDPSLLDRYGRDIPVLMVDGKKVAKYRITETELRQVIQSRGKG